MSLPFVCRACGFRSQRLKEYEDHDCPRWHPQPKPPLGVEPRYNHEARRLFELAMAISRYTHPDFGDAAVLGVAGDRLVRWTKEAYDLALSLKDQQTPPPSSAA